MTNRGRAHDPGMKCLTLTFSMDNVNVGRSVTGPKPKTRNGCRTPGYLPQPRHSVKSASHHKYTASPRSANFYQRKLNSDIDRLLIEDEPVKNPPPPKLPRSQSKPASYAGSNASSKSEHHTEYLRIAQSLSLNGPLLTARASSSIAPQSFLIDDLQNRPCTEINDKLGRPTRTTLLRNRQRSNSAPLSTYETREEIKRRNQLLLDQRNRPGTAANTKETFLSHDMDGESLHAFLTGARYNRAHYVDAKSLLKYGVYMPRGNPRACFMNENKLRTSHAQHYEAGTCAPPESPVSDVGDGHDQHDPIDDAENSTPAPPCTPAPQSTSAPHPASCQHPSQHPGEQQAQPESSRPRSGRSSARQAWGESTASLGDVDSVSDGYQDRYSNYLSKSPSTGPRLNITGRKLNYGGARSPAVPITPVAPVSHPYDSDSVPPPPPSVDFSSHIRLDLHGFQSAQSRGLRSHSDHSRTVRFSEPDEFGVLGKSITTPKGSPKHSKSVMKSDELPSATESAAVKFFMTEEPEPPAVQEPANDDSVDAAERVAGDDVAQAGDVTQTDDVVHTDDVVQADDVVHTNDVAQADDVAQAGDVTDDVAQAEDVAPTGDVTDDVAQADDVIDRTELETGNVDEDDANILSDVGAQWMQEAGVLEQQLGDGEDEENVDEDEENQENQEEDEERPVTPMKPVTAVDIARKPTEPSSLD